jgi:hypothetical protein
MQKSILGNSLFLPEPPKQGFSTFNSQMSTLWSNFIAAYQEEQVAGG